MADTTDTPTRRERVDPTCYRLGAETLAQIEALTEALRDHLGRPLTATDVVRLAVRDLHSRTTAPKKNSRKSAK